MSISKGKMKIGNRFILSGFLVLMTLLATMTLTTVTSFAATSLNVDGGTSQDLQKVIDKASYGSRIYISGTVTIDQTVRINKNVALTGSGTLVRENGFSGNMIEVYYYEELMMEGITIDGNGLICNGPAVYIDHGKFQMKSGTIKRNGDSGVYNYHGTFEMTGGNISENEASDGSGVYNNSGTFKMVGGSISGNKARDGGSVYNYYGTFEMTNGIISGNKASYGGGIYNYYGSTFKMMGGTISGNKASKGGGIYNNCGNVKITEEIAVITGNSPEDKCGC